ncbi:MAG: fructose-6-phosphate aldolase [Alphaproteobacteria bacterium]
MKFFVDSVNIEEIKSLIKYGIVDGITTNPSLIAKSNVNFLETIKEIASLIDGPVSAEVIATETSKMIEEALFLSDIASNIVIKIPLTWNGLETCNYLSKRNIKTNITLCFSANQALLAAKAGATYISPFVGRLDDIGKNGMNLIEDICKIYKQYDSIKTEILVASVRSPNHITEAAKLGAHIVTVPTNLMKDLIKHPLTEIGLKKFLDDWQNSGQASII